MDDLRHLSAEIGSLGDFAKNQAAYLQAMSQKANQLAQMIDSYIHGTIGNEASEICTAFLNAGDKLMKACFALMQASNVAQRWLSNHIPTSGPTISPAGYGFSGLVPMPFYQKPNSTQTSQPEQNGNPIDSKRDALDRVTMKKYRSITNPHSMMDDLKATNPNWREDSPWDVNCQRCVSAYEARRRGYDVTAAPLLDQNDTLQIMRHPNGWPSVYQGAELIDCTSASGTGSATLVEDKMAEWGDGARAIVRVRWKMGGGHVFIAERVNGKTVFLDPQRGTENVDYYFESAKGNGTFCVRIDNLPFTARIHDCIM